ncbi:hypothetical protein [Nitrosomonas aestuarii]|nr:hypothetical protein [Nitrosomonas aestuarii]
MPQPIRHSFMTGKTIFVNQGEIERIRLQERLKTVNSGEDYMI